MFPSQPGPGPPRTLGERVHRLSDELQRLAGRLKGEVARVVGEAVAGAVRDALRLLLGAATEEARPKPRARPEVPECWYDDLWDDPEPPDPEPPVAAGPGERRPWRWAAAWRVAAQAALWWLRRSPGNRPWLTTTLVALVGGTALVLGPSAGGAAGSAAGLLLTAGAAGAVGDWLAAVTP